MATFPFPILFLSLLYKECTDDEDPDLHGKEAGSIWIQNKLNHPSWKLVCPVKNHQTLHKEPLPDSNQPQNGNWFPWMSMEPLFQIKKSLLLWIFHEFEQLELMWFISEIRQLWIAWMIFIWKDPLCRSRSLHLCFPMRSPYENATLLRDNVTLLTVSKAFLSVRIPQWAEHGPIESSLQATFLSPLLGGRELHSSH